MVGSLIFLYSIERHSPCLDNAICFASSRVNFILPAQNGHHVSECRKSRNPDNVSVHPINNFLSPYYYDISSSYLRIQLIQLRIDNIMIPSESLSRVRIKIYKPQKTLKLPTGNRNRI